MAVTPVRTESPFINVVCPTRTPGTSVMEFNIPAAVDRYATVAIALGCERQNDAFFTAMTGVEKIRNLHRACGIPATLTEVGVREESISQMASEAMKIQRLLKNNPREIREHDAIDIYKAAL